MNKDGFFFTNDRMYGYTNHTPLFFHTDVTPRELEDAEFNDSLALKSGLESNGMDDPYYYEEGEEGEEEGEMEEIHEDEMELDPKAVGNLSDDPNQGDESADVDGLIAMKQIGDWIEGSALHAGSDIQLDLELEMLARSVWLGPWRIGVCVASTCSSSEATIIASLTTLRRGWTRIESKRSIRDFANCIACETRENWSIRSRRTLRRKPEESRKSINSCFAR